MGRSGRKRHLSFAERTELRLKAENTKKTKLRKRRQREEERKMGEALHSSRWVSRNNDPEELAKSSNFSLSDGKKARLQELIEAVFRCRPGLATNPYINGLLALILTGWIREPMTWQPQGKGLTKAFRSLASHLLGDYPVSDHLWDTLLIPMHRSKMDKLAVRFVAQVSRGTSLRELAGTKIVPPPLTRRMMHILANPPRPLKYIHLVRRAQVLGYGGTEVLASHLMATDLSRFHGNEPYWAEVIHWFCRQKNLDVMLIDRIVEFLAARVAEGEAVRMKGRGLKSLARDAEDYYRSWYDLPKPNRNRADRDAPFFGEWTGGSRCDIEGLRTENWEIRRIRTPRQMILEGNIMRHCLGTYRSDLAGGLYSFWSLSLGQKRKLTLEVENDGKRICAIAGKANQPPKEKDLQYVRTWADSNGVEIPAWIGQRDG